MSQNLHQFFQITDMISRLERQFFLPRYIINTWCIPTPLAPATSFSQLSPIIKESRTSDCVAERAK